MEYFPRPKAPFDRSIIGRGFSASITRVQRISFRRLALNAQRNQLIVRAMVAVNDLDSMLYLNATMMEITIDQSEGKDVEDFRRFAGQFHLLMHRRWLFRMSCVAVDDMITLFEKLRKCIWFRVILETPEVQRAATTIRNHLKTGHRNWVKGVRHKTAAHLDDDGVWASALVALAQIRGDATSKAQMSTKPYTIRYVVADEVITRVSYDSAWALIGAGDHEDEIAAHRVEWISKLMEEFFVFFQLFIITATRHFDLAV